MNLSSLSSADLEKILSAVMDSGNENANLVAGAVLKEQYERKNGHGSIQTGYQIELLVDGKWKTIDKTYFSIAVYSQFYASVADAQKAVDRINSKIKNKFFEYATKQIKKSEYRFVHVTTTRKTV